MPYCKICQSTDDTLFYSSIKTYCKEHWREKEIHCPAMKEAA